MARGLDPSSDRPVFQQIADHLRERILAGTLAENERLPSEADLMAEFGAARGTARQALAILKNEGLIHVEHGRGAFVRLRPPVRRLAHDRFARRHRSAGKAAFTVEAEAAGAVHAVEVLRVQREQVPADIAPLLQVRAGAAVLVRHRRYFLDDVPVELATSYIPWKLAAGTAMTQPDTGPGGIYARIEESGHPLRRFSEEVTARMPFAEERKQLRLGEGTPVFRLIRVAYDKEDQPVEVCDTIMAADRYALSYELPAT